MFTGEPDPRFAEKFFLVASVVSGNQSIEEIVSNRPDISERELKQWMHVVKEAARRSFTEPDLRARTVIKAYLGSFWDILVVVSAILLACLSSIQYFLTPLIEISIADWIGLLAGFLARALFLSIFMHQSVVSISLVFNRKLLGYDDRSELIEGDKSLRIVYFCSILLVFFLIFSQ